MRMRRSQGKRPMLMVLVKVPHDQKEIYSVKEVLGLQTAAKPLRARPGVVQCFRCQLWEHAQSRCTANIKCVSCGEAHFSRECPRPKKQPATCANCGEGHPANYKVPQVEDCSVRGPFWAKGPSKREWRFTEVELFPSGVWWGC